MTDKPATRHSLLKAILLLTLVLLVPVIPFLLVGEQSERWIVENLLNDTGLSGGKLMAVVAVVLVLASDILLPVPSSAVMTFTGASLGWLAGSAVCFVGLSMSCLVGYSLGRYFGLPLVKRFVAADELLEMTTQLDKVGQWVLAGFRGLPVLAEASVLVAGVYRFQPRRFWLAVTVANLTIAVIYNMLGHFARGADWLIYALVISVFLPLLLLLAWLVLRRLRHQ